MRFRSALAVLAACALFFAACSSDSGDDLQARVDEATDNSSTTASDGGSDTDTSIPDVSIPDVSDLSIPDLDGSIPGLDGSIPDLGNLGDCMNFALAYGSVFLAGLSVIGDEQAAADAQEQLDQMQAEVPPEIADEFAIVQEAYAGYWAALADSSLADMDEVEDTTQDPEVVAAQDAIDSWLEENCGG